MARRSDDRSTGGDDLLAGRRRDGIDVDRQRFGELALAEDLDRSLLLDQTLGGQGLDRDLVAGLEGVLETCHVDHGEHDLVGVVEARQLRLTPHQRHLATLEVLRDGAAGPGALGAAAGGLAATAAITTGDPLAIGLRARCGLEVVQFDRHDEASSVVSASSSSKATRCGTLRSIPRISGRSGWTTVCRIRFRPSDATVARWLAGRPISERVWVIRRWEPISSPRCAWSRASSSAPRPRPPCHAVRRSRARSAGTSARRPWRARR